MDSDTRRVRDTWAELLGEDHVAFLSEAGRVVDVIFGILAKETNKIPYFRGELEGRQKPDQVETVYKSLATIHTGATSRKKLPPGHSTLHKPGDGKKSKSLM